ncbi:NAD-dependent dehydratase [Bordetella genomosp. 10]|uniref:NAD-dependent dehydratase n=1 Tax=Bordetella genomosp. 10 TaxID=1416804 RepID=A0A261S1U7_9BORD|nr:complex I NDUFA9 subunit family protein [Bordetella genomosp. 10]OZI31306.1 NAD-dependent dehydratase [Bordetella genomosp. 10]
MRILILGGTGFVGRHLAAALAKAGHSVRVPTRGYAHGRDLLVLPTVTLFQADIHDDATLDRLVEGCDAVVNLVGILHGDRGKPYGAAFARAHVTLPQRVAASCRRHGVRRFVQMSALGADSAGPSMYLRSKGDGEAAVRQAWADAAEPAWTLVRPSIIFGADDNFTNLFARLARRFPVLPLAGAEARVQPVHVADVAAAIAAMIANPHAAGKTYELAGPQVYTLGEVAGLCARWSGHPRLVCRVPDGLGRLQAGLLAMLPGTPLMTPDNLDSLRVDNVASGPMAPELGVVPASLDAVAPGYLGRHAGVYF